MPERLQGRLQTGPLPGLLLPRDLAEEQRQREERQEAERAAAKAREALEKKKAGVGANPAQLSLSEHLALSQRALSSRLVSAYIEARL